MATIYTYENLRPLEFEVDMNQDIFKQILAQRKAFDTERFFLKYISPEDLAKVDLYNKKSLYSFIDSRCGGNDPIKGMAGCNVTKQQMAEDERLGGVRISDPDGIITGQFAVKNGNMYYSPFWGLFYKQYDLSKFARAEYFTTLTYLDLVMNQIEHAKRFYVHTGPNLEKGSISRYVFEKINRSQMEKIVTDPKEGQMILEKSLSKK